ncbi:PilN domain-containing protein [Petrachloros mirabilis]
MQLQRSFLEHLDDRVWSFLRQVSRRRYFRIELSSRHREYVAPVRSALVVASFGLGLWSFWCVVQVGMTFHEAGEIRTRLGQVYAQDRQLLAEAMKEGIDLSESSLQQLPEEVARANQLLVRRNFSWTQFLSGLEEAIPENVSIKGVRLDPANAMVHVTGLATTGDDVSAIGLKFQTHQVFYDPVLEKHRVGSEGFVEFELKVKYRLQGV